VRADEGFANFKVGVFKVGNLKRHHQSTTHKAAVKLFLKITEDPLGAPSAETFSEVWESLRSGNTCRSSQSRHGKYKRWRRMFDCLAESLREMDRRFLLQNGIVAVLHRDERTRPTLATVPNAPLSKLGSFREVGAGGPPYLNGSGRDYFIFSGCLQAVWLEVFGPVFPACSAEANARDPPRWPGPAPHINFHEKSAPQTNANAKW